MRLLLNVDTNLANIRKVMRFSYDLLLSRRFFFDNKLIRLSF